QQQADAAGLPLHTVELLWPSSNELYEARMRAAIDVACAEGVEAIAFGDLFLEDIRAYREKMLEGTGMRPIFPLWNRPTDALAREMIAGGLQAHVTCVDPKKVPARFAGRRFDAALLDELPADCDPCFERGEMHTFAFAGPMFARPVAVDVGVVVERDGFVFADLVPAIAASASA
ncbi:MAG: ATP-binding protein, partial [Polyangiales bacterium]